MKTRGGCEKRELKNQRYPVYSVFSILFCTDERVCSAGGRPAAGTEKFLPQCSCIRVRLNHFDAAGRWIPLEKGQFTASDRACELWHDWYSV